MNHMTTAALNQEDALADLMATLGAPDEIVINQDEQEPELDAMNVLDEQLALLDSELPELGADETPVKEAAEPEPTPEASEPEAAPAAAAPAPKADKPKAAPRKHYSNKVERLQDKLGNDLGDYTILELPDAALEGDALKAKQDETIAAIKAAGVKVQGRITFIMEFMAGKSAKLNGVIATAFKLLHEQGGITSGDEGNLQKALLAEGKTLSTSRAMSNNTIAAMRTLKAIAQTEAGYKANPNSLILPKVNAMLGLK